MLPTGESAPSRVKPLLLIQLSLDPNLYPELVALLSALPKRSRAAKVRLLLAAHMSGSTRGSLNSPENGERLAGSLKQHALMNSEIAAEDTAPAADSGRDDFLSVLDGVLP